jgi:hypothetical protein
MRLKALAVGALTFLPGGCNLYNSLKNSGGTDSARYCYSVWLRHLTAARASGLCHDVPRRVAELGPGDSLGIGIAALLSGAESYTGLDLLETCNRERNLAVFEELVRLFRERAALPGPDEFPSVQPQLSSYAFPADLTPALERERLELIRRSIEQPNAEGSIIRYAAPWYRDDLIDRGSVDMIFSQAVLEHVDDLSGAYAAMRSWLAPGSFMSHQIDYRCHGITREWNGHWAESDLSWKLLRGKRAYFINRQPHSVHIRHMRAAGFEIACNKLASKPSNLERKQLAPQFADGPAEDLTTCSAFIQARANEVGLSRTGTSVVRERWESELATSS